MPSLSENKKRCCSMQKKQLDDQLRKCDFCSTSYEEYHKCYQRTAKESGMKAKICMDL